MITPERCIKNQQHLYIFVKLHWSPSKGILKLQTSTSVLNQTGGSCCLGMPDLWDVVLDLLSHNTHKNIWTRINKMPVSQSVVKPAARWSEVILLVNWCTKGAAFIVSHNQ